jgi:hypothetical protein
VGKHLLNFFRIQVARDKSSQTLFVEAGWLQALYLTLDRTEDPGEIAEGDHELGDIQS